MTPEVAWFVLIGLAFAFISGVVVGFRYGFKSGSHEEI